MIEVGGRPVHVVRRFTAAVAGQSRTFVLEAACGWHAAMYAWIIEVLSLHGNVVAYDRAGLGWSPPSREIPDGEVRARELHELLEALQLPGRLVFVGHSIAGLYLRIFERRYPERVAGLVFLDPTHPAVCTLPRELRPLEVRLRDAIAKAASALRMKRLPFPLLRVDHTPWNGLPSEARTQLSYLSRRVGVLATERAEMAMLADSCRQAQMPIGVGDVPLLVITGGIRTAEEMRYTADAPAFMSIWMALQKDLVLLSIRGSHHVVEGAGHRTLVTDRQFALEACQQIAHFVVHHGI